MTRDWRLVDPYATWSPATATDDPDGRPDVLMVPLVEHLRTLGIVTLQSCSGHLWTDGQGNSCGSDGILWVRDGTVCEESYWRLRRPPFYRIAKYIHPDPFWELVWTPAQREEAVDLLREMLRPTYIRGSV